MNIFVFVKQVPHTESKILPDASGKDIDLKNVEWVINPYDEYAIEEGLRIREKVGGNVTAVSFGEDRVKGALKTALGMGVDNAIHILTTSEGYNTFQKAYLASLFLRKNPFDLLLCGKMGIDYYLSAFPVILSSLLNIPCISGITKLELKDKKAIAQREVEGGKEICETELPAIFTAEKGLNEPRYPTLRGLMLAQKKEIPTYKPEDIGIAKEFPSNIEIIRTFLPTPRSTGKIIEGDTTSCVKELVRLLREEARVI